MPKIFFEHCSSRFFFFLSVTKILSLISLSRESVCVWVILYELHEVQSHKPKSTCSKASFPFPHSASLLLIETKMNTSNTSTRICTTASDGTHQGATTQRRTISLPDGSQMIETITTRVIPTEERTPSSTQNNAASASDARPYVHDDNDAPPMPLQYLDADEEDAGKKPAAKKISDQEPEVLLDNHKPLPPCYVGDKPKAQKKAKANPKVMLDQDLQAVLPPENASMSPEDCVNNTPVPLVASLHSDGQVHSTRPPPPPQLHPP